MKGEIKNIQKPDLVLIDFDGVIAKNSPEIIANLFHKNLNDITPIKIEFIIDFFRLVMSFPIEHSLEYLFNSLGLTEKEINVFTEKYKKSISENLNLFQINDGFYDFIHFCKNKNIKYKVFSLAKDSRLSILEIEQETFYNPGEMSKADKATFFKVKKELHANNVLYIDDSPLGLKTGKLTNMNTIMMFNSLFGIKDYFLYEEYIDFTAGSFYEIQKIICNYSH